MDIRIKRAAFSLLALSLLSASASFGATSTWNGTVMSSGGYYKSTAANWDTPPVSNMGTVLIFPAGLASAAGYLVLNNADSDNPPFLPNPFQIAQIIISNDPAGSVYSLTSTGDNNAFEFFNNLPLPSLLATGATNAPQTTTFACPILNNQTGSIIQSVNGTLVCSSEFQGEDLAFYGNGSLVRTNPGTIHLTGDNTNFGGHFLLADSVILQFDSPLAFGTTTKTINFVDGTGISPSNGGTLMPTVSGLTLSHRINVTAPATFLIPPQANLTVTKLKATAAGQSLTVDGSGNGGTLIIGGSSAAKNESVIQGAGTSLTLGNSAVLHLHRSKIANAYTYTGDTSITQATLVAEGVDVFSPNSNVVLGMNGVLNLNNFDNTIHGLSGAGEVLLGNGKLTVTGSGSFNGAITGPSGGGGLTLNAPGQTLSLATNTSNLYYGNTTIASGTLRAGNTGAFSPQSLVDLTSSSSLLSLNNFSNTIGGLKGINGTVNLGSATLTVHQTSAETFAGTITGVGGSALVKEGDKRLILSGMSNSVDTTTVSSGTLAVNGQITSPTAFNVLGGGRLEGTGTIVGNVTVDGTVAPGNSIGTLNVIGNYTQTSNSHFLCEISPTIADKINVSGTVQIDSGATIDITPIPGVYPSEVVYTIIQAGPSLMGSFANVNFSSALLSGRLFYGSNYLSLAIGFSPFADLALKGNPHKVAVALDTVFASDNSALSSIQDQLFFLPADEIAYALDQMHPAQLKAHTLVQENNAVKVRDALLNHFSTPIYAQSGCGAFSDQTECCDTEQEPYTVWIDGFGDWLKQDSTRYSSSSQVGYSNSTAGFVLGADYHFADIWNVGALSGYTHSNTRWSSGHGHGTINSGYLGLYISGIWKHAYALASAIGAWSGFQDSRNIAFTGEDTTAKGNTNGPQLISTLDLGLAFNWQGFTVSPFDTLDYIIQSERKFTEHHAGVYDLKIRSSHARMLRNELGLNISRCECSHNIRWILDGKISWVREVRIHSGHFTSTFVGTDVPFTVTGYMPDRSLISPGASLTAFLCKHNLSLTIYYNGLYGEDYTDSTVGADLSFNF